MANRTESLIPVTVVIPVKNEERNLRKCLSCVKGFVEVLVVDSGSTDSTVEIAKEMGAAVIQFQWDGRFPKKRNWVLRNYNFKTSWVLFLDADEYIDDAFIAELSVSVANSVNVGFWLRYRNSFFGQVLAHGDVLRKLALFKIGAGEYEFIDDQAWSNLDMEVHEHPQLNGPVGSIKSAIHHEDFKGMRAYFDRHNQYSSWEAARYIDLHAQASAEGKQFTFRQRIKYGLINSWILGPLFFLYSYILRLGFMDRKAGFVYALCKMIYFWQIKIKIEELAISNRSIKKDDSTAVLNVRDVAVRRSEC